MNAEEILKKLAESFSVTPYGIEWGYQSNVPLNKIKKRK